METSRELELLRESWTETFDQLFVLYEVAREVSSVLDLDTVLGHILSHASLLLEAEAACALLRDQETGRLELKIMRNETGREVKKDGIYLKVGEGIAGEVVRTGKAMILTHGIDEKMFKEGSLIFGVKTARNLLSVPMTLRGGATVGVIEIINKKNGTFTSKDRDFLLALANISVLSVENAKIYKQLKSSEVYQSQVIENLPEGFFAVNGSGKITHMNSCAQKLLGLDEKQNYIGHSYEELLREDPDLLGHLKAAVNEGQVKRWREITLKKSGKSVFLFTFVFRKQDNSIMGAGAVLQDMVLKRG